MQLDLSNGTRKNREGGIFMRRLIAASVGILLVLWFIRYHHVNQGHLLTYSENPVVWYETGDTVPYGSNITYYTVRDLNGYSLKVQSAQLLEQKAFAAKYNVSLDDLIVQYPYYLILESEISNENNPSEGIGLDMLILRGLDWWGYCSIRETIDANQEFAGSSLSETASFQVPLNRKATIKLVFGLHPNLLTADRWEHFEQEEIWLTQTISPIEQRIRIHIK